jgi:hypothetical protein
MSDSCEASVWKAGRHGQRDHREEDRAHPQREQADAQREHERQRQRAGDAQAQRPSPGRGA